MSDTLTLTCANDACGEENSIMAPADDGWEPILEPDDGPERRQAVVGHMVTVRCPSCGQSTRYRRGESQ